jgi:hypothetical protein
MATIGDVVIVYCEEEPAFLARIEDVSADRRKDWYQVQFLVLEIPLSEILWILRAEYLDGETFTMNGRDMRIEVIEGPEAVRQQEQPDPSKRSLRLSAGEKVISLFDRKRG